MEAFCFRRERPSKKELGKFIDSSHLSWVQIDSGTNGIVLQYPWQILRYVRSAPARHGYASMTVVQKFAAAIQRYYRQQGFQALATRFGDLTRLCGCSPGYVESCLRGDWGNADPLDPSPLETIECGRLALSFFFDFFEPHVERTASASMLRWCGVFCALIPAASLENVLSCLSAPERSFWDRGVTLLDRETQEDARISDAVFIFAAKENSRPGDLNVSWSIRHGTEQLAAGVSSSVDWARSDAQRALKNPTLSKRLAPDFVLRSNPTHL